MTSKISVQFDLPVEFTQQAWVRVEDAMPAEDQIVDVWVSSDGGYRIASVQWMWNGGSEGFWDWHYADAWGPQHGEPLQMYDIEPDTITHWMPLPAAPTPRAASPESEG